MLPATAWFLMHQMDRNEPDHNYGNHAGKYYLSGMKYMLYLFIGLFIISTAQAQNKKHCDSVYHDVDSLASYPGGNDSLLKFINREMRDAFNECYQKDSTMITSMSINLIVSSKGKILDATFSDAEMTAGCRERMRKKLMSMKTWIPARHKGKAVCSYYSWLVGGVMWEDQ